MNNEGTVLLTGSYDKTILIWDLRSNTRDAIQTLSDFKDSVTSVLSTSNEIIAGCVDGNIRTYDIRNGRCHTDELADPITSINVSHDQRCLLSTCLGGQLRMTEISSGKLLQSYEG
jgi:mitogen-activated protein kinase organizer 1